MPDIKAAEASGAMPEPAIDNAKRKQILTGAREVFLSRGFDAASMGEIARTAGVSKGTLYVYFESKEELFRELISEHCSFSAEQLTPLETDERDIETVLRAYGRALITRMTQPEHIALVRIVIGAAEAFPDLGRAFFEAGPEFGARRIGRFLAAKTRDGLLDIDDPDQAAWHFMGLCKDPAMISTMMYGSPPPAKADIERYAEKAVKVFLRAYGPGTAG